jgi:hypothetical protein
MELLKGKNAVVMYSVAEPLCVMVHIMKGWFEKEVLEIRIMVTHG